MADPMNIPVDQPKVSELDAKAALAVVIDIARIAALMRRDEGRTVLADHIDQAIAALIGIPGAEKGEAVGYVRPDVLDDLATMGPPPAYLNVTMVTAPNNFATVPLYAAPPAPTAGREQALEAAAAWHDEQARQDDFAAHAALTGHDNQPPYGGKEMAAQFTEAANTHRASAKHFRAAKADYEALICSALEAREDYDQAIMTERERCAAKVENWIVEGRFAIAWGRLRNKIADNIRSEY